MKKYFYIFILYIFSSFLFPLSIYAQWYQQNSGTNNQLKGVSFVNTNIGFVVGLYGTILKTTNGGLNWNRQIISDTTKHLYAIEFINENTGIAVGNGKRLRTTNAGTNWDEQNTILTGRCISFININTGFICGDGIIKTTDGGLTWLQQSVPPSFGYYGISIVDSNVGFACGSPNGQQATVIKTTNGGNNWNLIYNFPAGNADLYGIAFKDPNKGVIVSQQTDVFTTTNGGLNWIRNIMTGGQWNSVYFIDNNHVIAVGGLGLIINSSNGGNDWTYQNSGTSNGLNSVFFLDSLNGYSVGYYGTILHTTTGGIEFIKKLNKKITADFQLEQNYPNPFNPITKIKFDISKNTNGKIILSVYNTQGCNIIDIVNEKLSSGSYEVIWDGTNYSSGIYFYRLMILVPEIGIVYFKTKKMILLK